VLHAAGVFPDHFHELCDQLLEHGRVVGQEGRIDLQRREVEASMLMPFRTLDAEKVLVWENFFRSFCSPSSDAAARSDQAGRL
jgi:hypothetical protein